jgi:hypothetical protein
MMHKKFGRFVINILLLWILLIRVDIRSISGGSVAVAMTKVPMGSEKLCEVAKLKLSTTFNPKFIFCLEAGELNDTP